MRRPAALWAAAFGFALAVHAAALFGLFYVAPASGAHSAGTGGIEISLGPSGAAAGAEAVEAPVAEAEAVEPEAAAEPVTEPPVEAAEAVPEVPVEPAPVTDAVPEVQAPEPAPVTEAVPVPVAKPEARPAPPERPVAPAAVAEAKPEREVAARPPEAAGGAGQAGAADGRETGEAADTAAGGLPGMAPDYAALLQAWLERHKTYPRGARVRRQEGQVLLYFAMDSEGKVLARRIQGGSGYPILDEEALAMLERASPLPPFPPDFGRDRLELVVPVRFRLKDLR